MTTSGDGIGRAGFLRLIGGRAKRALLVAAHPDDETIGLGGHLASLPDVTLLHLSDGAPRDPAFARRAGFADRGAYAAARRRELARAMQIAGVPPSRLRSLRLVDQEVVLHLEHVIRSLASLLVLLRPDVVLTHPYEGGHPDHDAAAFAVAATLSLLAARGDPTPAVVEMAFYHRRGEGLGVGHFLPVAGGSEEDVQRIRLDEEAAERKARMLGCFGSQREVIDAFGFDTTTECFRRAPTYDFGVPPHPRTLHYDTLDWKMKSTRWRALALRALVALDIRPAQVDTCPAR